jgi:heptosyltransferase-3
MLPIPDSFQPRRILVMELAGLGDNVHLLPALWLLRSRWPQAELHVMVNAHGAGLFKLTPWVQKVWSYPSAPKPGFSGNLRWGRVLREQRYDLVINSTGSDRSSLLTWLSRAPLRIGRRPADGGPYGWRFLFTDVVESPYYSEPMLWQKWRCFKQLGCAGDKPEFHFEIDPGLRRAAGILPADEGSYIHVSPFTSQDRKELPPQQLAELLGALRREFPHLRLVLSCVGNAREQAKLDALLPLLAEPPWKVNAGTLDVAGLAAVIQTCALNLSGDSAALHLAMISDRPALCWYRAHGGVKEWTPEGRQYRLLIAEGAPDALLGIATADLMAAARELLKG